MLHHITVQDMGAFVAKAKAYIDTESYTTTELIYFPKGMF